MTAEKPRIGLAYNPTIDAMPTDSGNLPSLRITISGHNRSFHDSSENRMASVPSAGFTSGTTTRKKMPYSETPSTRAASSTSCGMLSMYCRIRNTPKPSTRNGTIRPW